ncbi:MAG: DnaJ domain-containing protein [Archangium sp.]|nr:DnaJ domain-containing protein [Archangium sp.]
MSENLQVWVRNDKGQVYGPLSPPSVELLIDNQIIGGRMQVSTDGVNYVFPGRVPGLRVIFPRDTWGDTVIPGDELDAQWQQVVLPASIHGQGPTSGGAAAPSVGPVGPVGAPVAGPGVRGPVAGPGARGGPTAGPGTRQQPGRPMNPAQFGAQGRVASTPSGIAAAPMRSSNSGLSAVPAAPVRSSPSVADFMNAAAPAAPRSSSPSGVVAAPPAAAVRSSPSVADFMNAAAPAAPSAPAAPRAATPTSSSSGVRMAPITTSGAAGDLQVPASGALGGELTPLHLYYFAAASEVTGLLTVKLADRELVAHFKKGNPEFLDSTHPEDSLDTFLVAQKLATTAQIQQALAQSERFGGELLAALFGLGLINPNAVFQQLGQRASQLLLRLLAAEQGTFTFDREELPAARSMPLGNKWAVYLEALRRVPGPDLRRRLMSALELPVMKAGGRVAVTELRLTPQETRALNYFDGVRSLSQLLHDVPAEGDTLLRTAWMLEPLELVSFAGVSPSAPRSSAPPPRPAAAPPARAPGPPVVAPPKANPAAPAPAAAPQRPPPPVMAPQTVRPATAPGNPVQMPKPGMPYPGQPVAPVAAPPQPPPQRPPPPVMKPSAPVVTAAPPLNADAETKQLQATHDLMKKQNFFEVLGLKRDADPGAVKIAYLKAARSYHPDTVAPGSPEALAKLKADIFALISEANRTLSDPALRADYAAELDAGGTGSKVDMEKIFRGEELFQKARILVQARKYPDAVKMFEEAVICNPDEAEFYAWRGYAKFLQSKDKKAVTADVMRDLNLCVSKNPNVASCFYFLGYVAKANGDEKTALINFKKCVALDPKHIDAQRELRNAKK